MNKKAIIFDFDGIITDTEPIHMEAWLSVLEPHGITFDEDESRANYIGLNDRDFLEAVMHIHGIHFEENEKGDLIEAKCVASLNLLEHDIPLLPGVMDFISEMSKDYLLAICSGAQKSEIEYILKHLKCLKLFNPIVCSGAVKRGKPDPEGYIRALTGLRERTDDELVSESVIAIEDSPKGVEAAKAAGLKCLAVTNSYSVGELKKADMIVASLSDVSPEDLEGM